MNTLIDKTDVVYVYRTAVDYVWDVDEKNKNKL